MAGVIKVGLNRNRHGYWDPITRTNLSLDNPIKDVVYQAPEQLKNICHALFSTHPALVLYEGKIPEEAINAWKSKFDLVGLQIAKNRAERVNQASAATVNGQVVAQSVKAQAVKEEVTKQPTAIELSEQEIEDMTKAQLQAFIKENNLPIEFSAKTNAEELKELTKAHFGYVEKN